MGHRKEADPQAQGSFWEWGEDGPPGYLPLSDLIHLFFSALCSLYSDGLQDETPARSQACRWVLPADISPLVSGLWVLQTSDVQTSVLDPGWETMATAQKSIPFPESS